MTLSGILVIPRKVLNIIILSPCIIRCGETSNTTFRTNNVRRIFKINDYFGTALGPIVVVFDPEQKRFLITESERWKHVKQCFLKYQHTDLSISFSPVIQIFYSICNTSLGNGLHYHFSTSMIVFNSFLFDTTVW